jgi:hypothetical protein
MLLTAEGATLAASLAGMSPNSIATGQALPSLPEPGVGVTPGSVYLRWEPPHLPPAGAPPLEYSVQVRIMRCLSAMDSPRTSAVQVSTKWSLGWKDAQLLVVGSESGSSEAATMVCTFVTVKVIIYYLLL